MFGIGVQIGLGSPIQPVDDEPPDPAPEGFVYLLGADGAYLKGADGAYLLGVA